MRLAFVWVIMSMLVVFVAPATAAPCETLKSLSITNTTVTMAQVVAPGAFTQPGGRGKPAAVHEHHEYRPSELP